VSPRAVYRHVTPTIRHTPEGGITYEAFCAAADCGAESGTHSEQEAAQDWALRQPDAPATTCSDTSSLPAR
jgi:hypothetical protein